ALRGGSPPQVLPPDRGRPGADDAVGTCVVHHDAGPHRAAGREGAGAMTGRNERDEISRYAAGVRAALSDLDAGERAHLLEDLEAHLAEVVAESALPLADRLGEPRTYAAELRAAYGAPA